MSSQREYWAFYWPLTLTSAAMLLGHQFQNGILARYPDAERELAIFAIAGSLSFTFVSALVFFPQLVNVYARSAEATRKVFRFSVALGIALALPMLLAAYLPAGKALLGRLFHVEGAMLDSVASYLGYLAPLVLLVSLRAYYSGLLVQARLTKLVTLTHFIQLGTLMALLLTGKHLGWPAVETVAFASAVTGLLELGAGYLFYRLRYKAPAEEEHHSVTYFQLFMFFWPTALTSLMFSASRPVIFSFMSQLPNPTLTLAALRVGFDFGMLFFNPLNQFRHFFVTFGKDDPADIKRFMVKVMLVTMSLMLLTALTPASHFLLGQLLGIQGETLTMARQVVAVLCLVPLAMTLRNYYHGHLMTSRKTTLMGIGGVFRVIAIYLFCWAALHLGFLNHYTAAFALFIGFATEALIVSRTKKVTIIN